MRTILRRGNLASFFMGCFFSLIFISTHRWLAERNQSNQNIQLNSTKKIALVFGDSITQHGFNPRDKGWVALLGHFWSRKVDIINRGFSGYNSRWGLSIIDEVVIKCNPQLVAIFFGANDAVVEEGVTFVPLSEFSDNIEKMVLIIRQKLPLCSVVLITPPPVNESQLKARNILKGKKIVLDRTNERTMEYANACIDVGKKMKVPVLDAWFTLGGNSISRGDYLSDGLHLNGRGNERIFEAFTSMLKSSLPQWMPDSLPLHMATWTQLANAARQDGQ